MDGYLWSCALSLSALPPVPNIPSRQKQHSCYANVSSRQGADPDFPCKSLLYRNCTNQRLSWPWWSLSHWEISHCTSTPCTSPKRRLLNPHLLQVFPLNTVPWKSGWDKGSFKANWGRLRGRRKQGVSKGRGDTRPTLLPAQLCCEPTLAKVRQDWQNPTRQTSLRDAWERLVYLPRAWAMLFPGAKQVPKDES